MVSPMAEELPAPRELLFACKIDESQLLLEEEKTPSREVMDRLLDVRDESIAAGGMAMLASEYSRIGVRTLLLTSYDVPAVFYAAEGLSRILPGSAAQRIRDLGAIIFYGDMNPKTGRKRRPPLNIPEMVEKWHKTLVGLATAHDKDGVDRYEAAVEECLTPILTAPIKQVREFGPKLLESLKTDPAVPYLVWRAYEVWIDQMKDAPDEEIKQLKTDLAADIVKMVEEDAKAQLPDAMIHALMWRSPEKLQEVKEVVEREKSAGRGARLKGRESCLFLEAGGTVDVPEVCVQV